MREDYDWQRLDKFLWCARLLKSRAGCAALVAAGMVRINRVETAKPHAKVREGDVLTIGLHGRVLVWRIAALPARRCAVAEAAFFYTDLASPAPSCTASQTASYAPAQSSCD
jgi:ribosome-associated heat shock protein Hsp15